MKDFHLMKNKAKLFGIYLPVYLVITVATVTMRTIALFLHFSLETGYFDNKTLIGISDIILILSTIFLLSYICTARRDMRLIPDFTSPATYIPTGIVSVAIIFLIFSLFLRSLSTDTSRGYLFIIIIFTAIFAVLSLVHFALTALVESHSSTGRANFGICTVLFLALYSIYLYFSTELPINAPNKALDQMAYLLAAVFFLYETRISLGREMWRVYSAFALATAALTAYTSIPAIITYYVKGYVIFGSQNEAFISLEEYMLTFALFIYVTAKLFLTITLKEECPNEFVNAITAYAAHRENEVADSLEQFEQDFAAKQLSIFELYGEDDVNTAEAEEIQEQKEEEKPEERSL